MQHAPNSPAVPHQGPSIGPFLAVTQRLGAAPRQALARAARQAVERALRQVTVEHFLLALLDDADSQSQPLLDELEIAWRNLGMDLRNKQRQLDTNQHGPPSLHADLVELLELAGTLDSDTGSRKDIGVPHVLAAWILKTERFGAKVWNLATPLGADAVRRWAAERSAAPAAPTPAGSTESDPRLRFLDEKLDAYDPPKGLDTVALLLEALVVLASHPDTTSQPTMTHKSTIFGLVVPPGQSGIAPRFERTRSILRSWLETQDEETRSWTARYAIDRLLPYGDPDLPGVFCDLLNLQTPQPSIEVPYVFEDVVTPPPDVQAEWVRRLDEVLVRLESRIDRRGRVTDEAWAQRIRDEHEWDDDEAPVVVRGAPLSAEALDALQSELQAQGLYLPADYRAFLERYGGLALRSIRQGETPASDERSFGEDLISAPELGYPDDAAPCLMFFENLGAGYYGFEFGSSLRLVDQSGDWGGVPIEESRTAMTHSCFAEWLERYLDSGFDPFSYQEAAD